MKALLPLAALLAVAGLLLIFVFGAPSEEGVSIVVIRSDGGEGAPFTQYQEVEHPVRKLIGTILLATAILVAVVTAVVDRTRRRTRSL